MAARAAFGVLAATVIAVACSSTPTNDPTNPPQGPGPGGLIGDGGGIAPAVKQTDGSTTGDADAQATCEELGDLGASGLLASYDADSRWFTGGLTGRPVLTELSVVGVGAPADIQGTLVTLGVGLNANYATCTHCMLVLVGCTATDCNSAKTYFAEAGNAYFNQVSTGPGQPFVGQFADVTLREVTLDATLTSTNVASGACFHLSSFAFSAMTGAAATAPPDAGGSSGGANTAGSRGRGSGLGGTQTPPPIAIETGDGGTAAAGDGGSGSACATFNQSCVSAPCCDPGVCSPITRKCALERIVPGGP